MTKRNTRTAITARTPLVNEAPLDIGELSKATCRYKEGEKEWYADSHHV